MGRSFWRSVHIRCFPQLNFSSTSAKCNSPATLRGRTEQHKVSPACSPVHQTGGKSTCLWVRTWVYLQVSEFSTTWRASVYGFPLLCQEGAFESEAERSKGHEPQPWQCICSTSSSLLGLRLGHHLRLCRTPLGASHLLSLKFKPEQSLWDKFWISLQFHSRYLWVFRA